MLTCAALSAASCATAPASNGAGYAMLHPSAETRAFIFANDRPFTREVAAHNATCARDEACLK